MIKDKILFSGGSACLDPPMFFAVGVSLVFKKA